MAVVRRMTYFWVGAFRPSQPQCQQNPISWDVGGLAAQAHIRNKTQYVLDTATLTFYMWIPSILLYPRALFRIQSLTFVSINDTQLLASFALQTGSLTSPSETGCLVGVHQVAVKSSPHPLMKHTNYSVHNKMKDGKIVHCPF